MFPPEGVSKLEFLEANPDIREQVRNAINDVTKQFGGSISAEHGIGRLKINDLETYEGSSKLNAIQAIKKALDPNNIMNPGAMVETGE